MLGLFNKRLGEKHKHVKSRPQFVLASVNCKKVSAISSLLGENYNLKLFKPLIEFLRQAIITKLENPKCVFQTHVAVINRHMKLGTQMQATNTTSRRSFKVNISFTFFTPYIRACQGHLLELYLMYSPHTTEIE